MTFPFEDVGEITIEHAVFAAERGIPPKTVIDRYYEYSWTLEETLTTPYRAQRKTDWMKWRDTAVQNGINEGAFAWRVANGWSYQRAATKPVRKRNTA